MKLQAFGRLKCGILFFWKRPFGCSLMFEMTRKPADSLLAKIYSPICWYLTFQKRVGPVNLICFLSPFRYFDLYSEHFLSNARGTSKKLISIDWNAVMRLSRGIGNLIWKKVLLCGSVRRRVYNDYKPRSGKMRSLTRPVTNLKVLQFRVLETRAGYAERKTILCTLPPPTVEHSEDRNY